MQRPDPQPVPRRGPPAPCSVLGWSHRAAPLDVLETVSVPQRERPALLRHLAAVDPEVVLLSTCSRTEVYTRPGAPLDDLLAVLAHDRRCRPELLVASAERRSGFAALEHLFRVTAGLESRIVGEPEICGQVRRAVRDARRAGTVHSTLTPVFSAAVSCAQRVRDVSGLGTARRSWGARAVDVGLQAVPVSAPHVVVVGSGRMAADVVEVLHARSLRPVVVARDLPAARRLVGDARVRPLARLVQALREADLVCCATSAAHDVITAQDVRTARHDTARVLAVVDLSVPRNVEPRVGTLPGVCLLGPQDLADDAVADDGLTAAVDTGAALVRVEAERYLAAVAVRRAGPLIAGLRGQVQELCLAELQRGVLRGAPAEEVERVAHRVAVRLLHRPTLTARAAAAAGDAAALRLLAEAFGLPVAVVPDDADDVDGSAPSDLTGSSGAT